MLRDLLKKKMNEFRYDKAGSLEVTSLKILGLFLFGICVCVGLFLRVTSKQMGSGTPFVPSRSC